jgi:hypothetical protein
MTAHGEVTNMDEGMTVLVLGDTNAVGATTVVDRTEDGGTVTVVGNPDDAKTQTEVNTLGS